MLAKSRLVLLSSFKKYYSSALRHYSSTLEKNSTNVVGNLQDSTVGNATDKETEAEVSAGIERYENFLTSAEEESLMKEIEPQFKRLRYEDSHWDDAIQGFREIERRDWSLKNKPIIERIMSLESNGDVTFLKHTHILDLSPTGVIRPHVDSVKFCGSRILGLCLLSDCIMRFRREDNVDKFADVLLPRYCLYVMKDKVRYEYTHEVLKADESILNGKKVEKGRRISVLLRTQPSNSNVDSYSYKT